jgi:hypothetical protein
VGEVDQLQDPVDERVAERDQGVDRAGRQPDQEDVEEVGRRLVEIDREPREQQRDEAEADDRERRRTPSPSERGPRRGLLGTGFDSDSGF